MTKINILLICMLVVLIHHTYSLPTNFELKSSLRNSIPLQHYSSYDRQYRQVSPDNIPDLTSSLFHEFQKNQNNHQEIIKSGNIDLNTLKNIQSNLYILAANFVNSVKRTISLLTSSHGNNDGTVNVVRYTQPTPSLVRNYPTNSYEISSDIMKNFTFSTHQQVENQFAALPIQPNLEKTYEPYASGYDYSSSIKSNEEQYLTTTENYELTDEDIRRTVPLEKHMEATTEHHVLKEEDIRAPAKFEDTPLHFEDTVVLTAPNIDVSNRNGFSKEDINAEVKNIDFFSDLTVPDEKPVNIFFTNSEEAVKHFPGLNLTEIPLPDEDSLNVFFINSNSNVINSSIKLNSNADVIKTEDSKPKIYTVVYNFPLPLSDSNVNFKSVSSKIFENFETSTFSSFHTEIFGEQQLPKLEGSNLKQDRKNLISPQESFDIVQLPKTTTLDNFNLSEEVFLPNRNNFDLENDGIDQKEIVKKENTPDYNSLSEIPLEDSPVFDLKKQDLTNSYGRRVNKFRRQIVF